MNGDFLPSVQFLKMKELMKKHSCY
ncbi:hypothetical protein Avbf_15044 [Armadillidium vulgare]|nr:hypothetical protein Avbf_14990 [Armadillidium vulgare]RXG67341.1 hypothetical protein Avbf_15044 [Armadillidium vulgare]